MVRHYQSVRDGKTGPTVQCGAVVGSGLRSLWITFIPCKITCPRCKAGVVSCH